METGRFRIDSFVCALGGFGLLTVAFVVERNGAAVIMCGLCVAGLLTARGLGFPGPGVGVRGQPSLVVILLIVGARRR